MFLTMFVQLETFESRNIALKLAYEKITSSYSI